MSPDDKVKLSMGARVDAHVCSICGQGHGSDEHVDTEPLKTGQVRFLYATVTPAPPCEACGNKMTPVSASEWACQTDECEQHGKPRVTGVYPIQGTTDGR